MTKSFDQSLIDTALIPMSMIDPDDMEDKTSEEFKGLRRVQQGCHNELSNREDFPFNRYKKALNLKIGVNAYPVVDGRIDEIYLDGKELKYLSDFNGLDETKTGKPEFYTTTDNPEKLKVYPTPDDAYTLNINYFSTRNILLSSGDTSYIIEPNSTLRMPERFQHLYFDALEYYVLATNMRKQSNARWQPTLEIFREKWKIFLKGCKNVEIDTVFEI